MRITMTDKTPQVTLEQLSKDATFNMNGQTIRFGLTDFCARKEKSAGILVEQPEGTFAIDLKHSEMVHPLHLTEHALSNVYSLQVYQNPECEQQFALFVGTGDGCCAGGVVAGVYTHRSVLMKKKENKKALGEDSTSQESVEVEQPEEPAKEDQFFVMSAMPTPFNTYGVIGFMRFTDQRAEALTFGLGCDGMGIRECQFRRGHNMIEQIATKRDKDNYHWQGNYLTIKDNKLCHADIDLEQALRDHNHQLELEEELKKDEKSPAKYKLQTLEQQIAGLRYAASKSAFVSRHQGHHGREVFP